MSLPAIAIEPSYFAFDQRDFKNGEELERRILLLTSARRLIAENAAIAILTSDETDAELVRTNYYPYHDRLENLLRRCGLGSAYSANDIRVIVQDVIGRSESLEEYVGVAFAFYDSDANTTPDCTPCYADAGLLSVFVQVLGIISAGMIRNSAIRDTLRLSCPPSKFYSSVQFSGTLLATDPDFGIQGEVVENIVLSDEYKSFIAGLDGLKLWRTAEDAQGFLFSLFVGVAKKGSATGMFEKLSDIPVFAIGSEFADSLARNQAMGKGRFSRATYETALSVVCGNAGQAMWRVGSSKRNKIARADGALAWRSHVASRHEALRLMYWTLEGKIEFANVGLKNELVIAAGGGQSLSSEGLVEL